MKCVFCQKEKIKKISFDNLFSKKEDMYLCEECKKQININATNIGDYTLYYFGDYDFFKEIIYKIKYYGAIHEAEKFSGIFKLFFKNFRFDLVTIVPINNTRKYSRGFDHIAQLCNVCNVKYTDVLKCDYREKQSKLHKKREKHKFRIIDNLNFEKYPKRILIIDDVITSGNTLISCAEVLKERFPDAEICFLTLAKSYKKCDVFTVRIFLFCGIIYKLKK